MSVSPDTFPDKHPDVDRPYSIDWGKKDLQTGETIASSAWSIEGPDALLMTANLSFTSTVTTIFLSGGTLGAQYKVTNEIVTNSVPPKHLVSVKRINIRDK
jgi:hypothetical protein